jgi:hypothetical protein
VIGTAAIASLVVLVAAVALGTGLAIAGFFTADDRDGWARANAIELTPDTDAALTAYLRNRRGLRRMGAFAGLVLPPAVTAATGLDLKVSGVVWVLLGYLIGLIVAEITFARVPDAGPRMASLSTRRVGDYLPRTLVAAQVLVPAANVVLALVAVRVLGDRPPPAFPPVTGSSVTQDLLTAAVVAGPVALVLAAGALLGQRALVRRPQPMVEAELVALDDAMRSSSVRTIAATSVATTSFLVATQLGGIDQGLPDGSLPNGLLFLPGAVVVLAAFVAWQRWVNRGWRVRRAAAPVLEVRP